MYREPLTAEQEAAVIKKTQELVAQAKLKDSIRQADLLKMKAIVRKMFEEKK